MICICMLHARLRVCFGACVCLRFGKAAKEALRRRRFMSKKRERELGVRYHMEDNSGFHLVGDVQVRYVCFVPP